MSAESCVFVISVEYLHSRYGCQKNSTKKCVSGSSRVPMQPKSLIFQNQIQLGLEHRLFRPVGQNAWLPFGKRFTASVEASCLPPTLVEAEKPTWHARGKQDLTSSISSSGTCDWCRNLFHNRRSVCYLGTAGKLKPFRGLARKPWRKYPIRVIKMSNQ